MSRLLRLFQTVFLRLRTGPLWMRIGAALGAVLVVSCLCCGIISVLAQPNDNAVSQVAANPTTLTRPTSASAPTPRPTVSAQPTSTPRATVTPVTSPTPTQDQAVQATAGYYCSNGDTGYQNITYSNGVVTVLSVFSAQMSSTSQIETYVKEDSYSCFKALFNPPDTSLATPFPDTSLFVTKVNMSFNTGSDLNHLQQVGSARLSRKTAQTIQWSDPSNDAFTLWYTNAYDEESVV